MVSVVMSEEVAARLVNGRKFIQLGYAQVKAQALRAVCQVEQPKIVIRKSSAVGMSILPAYEMVGITYQADPLNNSFNLSLVAQVVRHVISVRKIKYVAP